MASKARAVTLVHKEISDLTTRLVELSLSNDQNFPYIQSGSGQQQSVLHPGDLPPSAALKDRPYEELYTELRAARAYNVLMLDGAMLQLTYSFDGSTLITSRLAFLPSPNLLQFQNSPDEYLEDELYADIVDRRIVTVPLRFDYDDRPGVHEPVHHPRAHLTLGQYAGCRIATTSPITPFFFVEFVLRSFYNTATRDVAASLPKHVVPWSPSITSEELRSVHIGIPDS